MEFLETAENLQFIRMDDLKLVPFDGQFFDCVRLTEGILVDLGKSEVRFLGGRSAGFIRVITGRLVLLVNGASFVTVEGQFCHICKGKMFIDGFI